MLGKMMSRLNFMVSLIHHTVCLTRTDGRRHKKVVMRCKRGRGAAAAAGGQTNDDHDDSGRANFATSTCNCGGGSGLGVSRQAGNPLGQL